jgi:excisionase family DNA binding protein
MTRRVSAGAGGELGISVTVLTADELAARWVVDRKTIYAAINAGEIPAFRLGRLLRVPLEVVRVMETQGSAVPTGGSDGSTTR